MDDDQRHTAPLAGLGAARGPGPSRAPRLTQQSHTFDRLAERFGGRYRCIALDFRGRGESEWAAPETYALPRYVDDVVKLLDALEIPAAHILGISLGGLYKG